MSDYVGSLQTIQLSFDSDIEVITPQLEKIQFTNSGTALLSRPDKLHAHRIGAYTDVEMVFDGKTVGIYGKHVDGYARFEAPGSVDQLIHALRDGHGVALPAADLLLSNAFEVLVADVEEAKYVGRGVIGGVECEHLAFRNFDTDWQLWVEVGERPVPRKMVITSKTINSAPQYTVRITQWKSGVKPPGDAFDFQPPKGARQLDGRPHPSVTPEWRVAPPSGPGRRARASPRGLASVHQGQESPRASARARRVSGWCRGGAGECWRSSQSGRRALIALQVWHGG